MNVDAQLLWSLLPAYVRVADAERGGLLHGLVTVLADHAELIDADIDALGDDWFIETCAEWLVPYLGDLVGAEVLHTFEGAGLSNRARIADTLRYRRRKGTITMLEELARTATGWPARAVEFFEQLSTTQQLNHVRLAAPATALIRDANGMELVDTPFDGAAHTVDVRPMRDAATRVAPAARHNLPNVGLYVWPVPSYPLDRATAVAVTTPPDGRWLVEVLGIDRPMAGPTAVEVSIDHRAAEFNVPMSVRRRPLHDELDALRAASSPVRMHWFAADDPTFTVWIQPTANDTLDAVELENVFIADLSDWSMPTGSHVRVDPVLGRVAVAAARPVDRLAVSWSYNFSGDVGAGPYPRQLVTLAEIAGEDPDQLAEPDFQIGVSVTDEAVPGEVVPAVADAVDAWHAWQTANPSTTGRIVLMDSHRYAENFTGPNRIDVAQGCRLSIVAARWPTPPDGPRQRLAVDLDAVRPCVAGAVEVAGTGTGDRPGELWIDGVLLDGPLTAVAPPAGDAGLGVLGISHSTVVPAGGGVDVEAGNDRVACVVYRSITGRIRLAGDRVDLHVTESVVDGATGSVPAPVAAIVAPGADAELHGATVLGTSALRTLRADDSIFDDVVSVERRQHGCVRFCYVTPGSATPRRYHCQPDRAIDVAPGDPGVAARLEPAFTSTELGHLGYARLSEHAATELLTGAESGAEIGAFRFLLRPQRLANLADALAEYLPFGREAAALPVLARQGDLP